MKGKLIAFEGIDQSGKRTQSNLLHANIIKMGYNSDLLSFPVYETNIGSEIRKALRKKNYPVHTIHMMLSANRWEHLDIIKKHLKKNDFLVSNRYFHSNLAYGLARGLDKSWLVNLDKGLPKPDLVILLDNNPNVSLARKNKNRDNYENIKFLKKVRKIYLDLSKKNNWIVVKADKDRTSLSDEITKKTVKFFNV
ncbi:MAG: dTMP kinase [Thermoproteota archaeon]